MDDAILSILPCVYMCINTTTEIGLRMALNPLKQNAVIEAQTELTSLL